MALATLICHIFAVTKVYIAEKGNLNSQEVYSHYFPEISVTEALKLWACEEMNKQKLQKGTKIMCQR